MPVPEAAEPAEHTPGPRDGEAADRARFPIDPFARYCLLEGVDELSFLIDQEEAIAAYEGRTAPEARAT